MTGDASEMSYRVTYTDALRDVNVELKSQSKLLGEMQAALTVALNENKDLKTRVRSLELRFYGILAGLVTAIGVLIYQGGGIN